MSNDTFIRPLTPAFREEINTSIDKQIEELKTCKPNPYVNIQLGLNKLTKSFFNSLPDGYLIPCTKNQKGE